jgi:hypothetical protein
MEYTEQEDNFQLWQDTIKDHHPDINLDSNLIMLLRTTFNAGYWAGSNGIDLETLAERCDTKTH